jgi:hypothetical protein
MLRGLLKLMLWVLVHPMLTVSQRQTQIADIGGTFCGVVGRDLDPLLSPIIQAGRQLWERPGIVFVQAQVKLVRVPEIFVIRQTVQIRVAVLCAALIE